MTNTQLTFSIDRLLPCDIILIGASTLFGVTYRGLSRTPYSHAILHLRNGICIEAVPDVTRPLMLQRYHINDLKNVSVRRLDHLSNVARSKASAWAERLIGRFYNLKPLAVENSQTMFCSMLVALAYQEAGYEIAGKDPRHVSPADIHRDRKFSEITDDVTHIEASANNRTAIDGSVRDVGVLGLYQSTVYAELMKEILPDYKRLGRRIAGKEIPYTSSRNLLSVPIITYTLETMTHHLAGAILSRDIKAIDTKICDKLDGSGLTAFFEDSEIWLERFTEELNEGLYADPQWGKYLENEYRDTLQVIDERKKFGVGRLQSTQRLFRMQEKLLTFHEQRLSLWQKQYSLPP